jgi:malonyl-CoA O-methyltransferase
VYAGLECPYPEVTGYFIPTLLGYGFKSLAMECADYLAGIQRPSGAFTGWNGQKEWCFDTAQVLRGLLAISAETDQYDVTLRAAGEYLFRVLRENGGRFPAQYDSDRTIPEAVLLFALPPMMEYSKRVRNDDYARMIRHCAEYYLEQPDTLSLSFLTHFLAYQMDGLIDLGYRERVTETLDRLIMSQTETGWMPAHAGAEWSCPTGCAQIAVCLYKMNHDESADRLMEWLDSCQESSGGFLGGVGTGAWYHPDKELSWAVKFYLDAYRLRIRSFFQRFSHTSAFPADIAANDGRVLAVAAEIRDGDAVMEIGCGKGRILRRLREQFPACSFTGLDIAPAFLDCVPTGIDTIEAYVEHIPCADHSFHVVYAVEVLEHSVNLKAAVSEMIRICVPGGKIIVVDKQLAEWGRAQCPPWERWPERGVLEDMLAEQCAGVVSETVRFENSDREDRLMVKWMGVKK